MSGTSLHETEFIKQAESLIQEQLSNEQFGVSELAEAMHMSRSSLLRKIKKQTGFSASQFIRQIRLREAMVLLKQGSMTVSEISYRVGFGSTSYFIKCFREYYGYPPGEAAKKGREDQPLPPPRRKRIRLLVMTLLLLGLVTSGIFIFKKPSVSKTSADPTLEKSIAVLPFKNESADTTNVYFINGLMESTLNNLQKIEDLRVVSRTSVEQYRNTEKAIPEIARELNVNYFVEGSGQKVGDQVLLHIQLIEAASDRPIWSEQYSRRVGDIFALQNEVARKIADAIEALVTPAELEQIGKVPTENLVAYDYYLQALEHLNDFPLPGAERALPLLEKAVEEDPQFSLAYANIAIAYFFMDLYKADKQHTQQINEAADKALLYDSHSAESLIAKALYYMNTEEYRLALPHLEKALEYNPNSAAVIQILSDYYARIIPDTGKYLEYALMGVQRRVGDNDSTSRSYTYLHLSNALVQSGFVDEALIYINQSLAYDRNNYYAPLLKVFMKYAKDRDLVRAREGLRREWQKDTTRLDILQEVAKFHYFERQYDSAYYYYHKFVRARESNGLNILPQEDAKIGYVYEKMGFDRRAADFFRSYADYCEKDQSIYKGASMAVKLAHEGKPDQAIEQLRIFSRQENYQYWILLFMEMDPMMEPLKRHPDYPEILKQIKDRFWENQAELKKTLQEKDLM